MFDLSTSIHILTDDYAPLTESSIDCRDPTLYFYCCICLVSVVKSVKILSFFWGRDASVLLQRIPFVECREPPIYFIVVDVFAPFAIIEIICHVSCIKMHPLSTAPHQ
ncbi:hypothetical protein V6N13_074067 [Hibiscus sabdariffa]|uniref:Uncharacterized protein n=1 Tax=Hibiscus sabdariffa TaxID=183260 RepID=A0ABR2U7P3_9ROSI